MISFFVGSACFFHFKWVKCTVFLYDQIYLIHILITVKIQRRLKNTFIIIAFDYFGYYKAFKECTCHSTAFEDIGSVPFCQISCKTCIKEI